MHKKEAVGELSRRQWPRKRTGRRLWKSECQYRADTSNPNETSEFVLLPVGGMKGKGGARKPPPPTLQERGTSVTFEGVVRSDP